MKTHSICQFDLPALEIVAVAAAASSSGGGADAAAAASPPPEGAPAGRQQQRDDDDDLRTGIASVGALEDWLEASIAAAAAAVNDEDDHDHDEDPSNNKNSNNNNNNNSSEEPTVLYAACPDVAYLVCPWRRRRRRPKKETAEEEEVVSSSITGLLEETDHRETPVRVTLWKRKKSCSTPTQQSEHDRDAHSISVCCCCRHPHRDWTRKPLQYEPPPPPRPSTAAAAASNAAMITVHWVDLSGCRCCSSDSSNAGALPLFSNKARVVHALRSLLGAGHEASPWVANTNNDETSGSSGGGGLFEDSQSTATTTTRSTTDNLLLLQVPGSLSSGGDDEALTQFRVSDACPSWCLYSTVKLPAAAASSNTSCCGSTSSTILVYRQLPPRLRLSSRHPVTQEPVPTAGCLWETVVTYPPEPDDSDKNNNNGNKNNENHQQQKAQPIISYRLTAPPYVSYESEYNNNNSPHNGLVQLQKLLEPAAQQILQKEAASIPQWTAWPEQQHYVTVQDGVPPWNVFPLCHCFPANDPTKLTWVAATAPFVPETVQLLKDCAGPALRTALFSRLDPGAVLEAHTGWADLANHVLRVHVPVQIPGQHHNGHGHNHHLCGTWVDGCVAAHAPDRLLAFDDSKIHRAFNYHPDRDRVVLIVDLARPAGLPAGTATGGHSEELDAFIAQFARAK